MIMTVTLFTEGSVPTVYSVAVGMHENCADLKDVLARASLLKGDEKLLLAKELSYSMFKLSISEPSRRFSKYRCFVLTY
ncbi:hypothetical protein ACH5RR_040524 [Cinchona calisaya]|uniref:Uncharacterized protein n=1 Tax=Cinchona calisaya TaxID=153742 RepID=A0ABD2XW45_9GENT